ncbi:RHS repeat domain-containing protein [Cellulomonas carbonis]|uniref:RHS repeat domain-containing protein n=1 Tax=Cellulomonas carbonis TaxID=1386092 RepID=UPI00166B62DD|nr:RHS repeat-associated core domain-containing protein [Cellulomonas carbonis]
MTATAAVVVGALPAAAAAPTVPTGLTFERAVTHTPVLAGTVSDPDGGAVTARFFARTAGASTWNVVNGATVAATSGQVARTTLPVQAAGTTLEWTMKSCDAATCSAAAPVVTSVVSPMLGAGPRKNATALPFQLGDRVSAKVDVGTGNLMLTAEALSVPGVHSDVPVQLVYNSLSLGAGVAQASTSNPTGYGWTVSVGMRLEAAADGSLVFHGPAGLTGTFVPAGGGAFTAPAGLTADLVALSGGGWALTDHASQQKLTFNASGILTTIADRNGNTHTLTYDPYNPTRLAGITATRGPAGLDVTFAYTSGRLTSIRQGPSGSVRTVGLGYNGSGDLTTITDALNRTTTFTYTAHQLTRVQAPGGIDTYVEYDVRNRVTAVRQVNGTAGSAGDSWTRLAYTSDTQTLVSDGEQETTGSPTSGERTAYTLAADRTGRVTKAVDAEGRERAATYTANYDPATATTGAGTSAATTTMTYGANSGESLTSLASPTGATRGWEYTNTAAATKYLPTSSTDDAGNSSAYTYNGAGNVMTSTDALAAQAVLTRNTNGTVVTATAPGNGTNKTTYTYTNAQVTKVTPVTGSSLGVRDFTYDTYGRLKTATNGRGVTTTYSYDLLDRLTGVDYSGTNPNPDVSFTYDTAGRQGTRTDTSGTTTWTYDQVGNLTSVVNTFDNATITYGYDRVGRMVSTTDSGGTTTYGYDDAGALVTMQYPHPNGGTATTNFAVDDKGRRTDTWMRTNPTNTIWAAHSHTDYDTSGRPSRIKGERRQPSSGSQVTTVVDLQYCYAANSTYPTCSTSTTDDRSFVQWRRDHVTGQTTTYTYDGAGRLTQAATTAGTNATAHPAVTHAYAYDARGNRTSATVTTGGSSTTQTRTHNAANQTTSSGFTYDGAGNLTADPAAGTIAYTAGDQMASVTKAGTTYDYTYAGVGNGELVRNETPGGTYSYTYGTTGAVGRPAIERVTLDGNTAHLDNDPTGQPVQIRTSTGQDLLYIYDGLGSPVALLSNFNTTAFEYSFDPYGVAELETTSGGNATVQTPFLYTGGLHDRTTDWIKNGARYYTPTEGRWTQHDTLDAPLDPANANRYAYAANNPINYIDPTGRFSWAEFGGNALGAFVGALIIVPAALGGGPVGAAAGAAVGGCIGGAVAEGTSAALSGGSASQGDIGGACLGGAVLKAFG